MARRSYVILALLAIAARAPGGPALAQSGSVSPWASLVGAHRLGTRDRALIELANWDAGQLGSVLDDLRKTGSSIDAVSDRSTLLIRGALVHTDIAQLAPVLAVRFVGLRGWPSVGAVSASDGHALGVQIVTGHWRFARELLALVRPRPADSPLVRDWYRAVGATHLADRNYALATLHLDAALQLFPDDGDINMLSGLLHEAMAALARQEPLRNSHTTLGSASQQLRWARAAFERAIDAQPDRGDAHLHLGRVLSELGEDARALASLRTAVDTPDDPDVRYCAELMSGALEERGGRPALARAHYEAAAALRPTAQSPLLALSHLARDGGDGREAVRQVRALRALPDALERRSDPWWDYYTAPVVNDQALLEALWRRLDPPPVRP